MSLAAVRRPQLWQAYLAVGTLLCALYALVPPFAGSGPVMNLLGLSPVVAILVGLRLYQPKSPGPWWCFAIGFTLFWCGDLYTYSYPRLFGADVPFPSPGDAAYVAVYPALMAGLLLLVRRRNPESDRPGVIDSLIMTLGLALLSWVGLIAPYLEDGQLTIVAKLVSIAYPLGDILLLAAAIRLAVDTGKRQPAFYLLTLSIVALLVTDFVYGLMTLNGSYDGQVLLDVGWISFYLLWGAAALHPSMRGLEEAEADREPRLTGFRLALLTGASLIAPGVELVQELKRGDVDLIVIIAASVDPLRARRPAHGRARPPARALGRPRADPQRRRRPARRRHEPPGDLRRRPGRGARARRPAGRRPPVPGRGQPRDRRRARGRRPRGRRRRGGLRGDGRRAAQGRGRRGHDARPGGPRRAAPRARPRARRCARALAARGDPRPAGGGRRHADLPLAARQPPRARDPGLAGARERGADRGGPPAHLRLPGPARERPHHRARLRRDDRLPEPVDRARARVLARGGHRHPLRPPARPGRAQPAVAPARRRHVVHRQPDRGLRVHAAPRRRRHAPVRDPPHEPPARRARARHRAQRPRRLRAQGVRGAARPPGLPRPRHRPRQPRAVRRAGPPRRRPRPARERRARGHLPRPGRLQDRQRQPRPRGRRPGPDGGRQAPRHQRALGRHRRALRRRRVRGPARGRRERAGGGRGREPDPRVAGRAAADRPEGDPHPRQPRDLGGRGRRRHRRRRADPQRRRRDVHRQARRQGRLPPVRAGDARRRARPPRAARRPPAGA